ncbi:hypothetical protein GCM10007304_30230 [Rhodococcoides trifolii]|uniref:Uncharacterized protein n=1 Tax=Rhodococcoides trifolii TaxID=908250 RepID=A0A917FYD9_9NOCA|nr:hypothetical protein [Rhodococcus trifolii]GGG14099.1 hypothetical protein GCM10007304_30230 [Rhodococcus trifolii]
MFEELSLSEYREQILDEFRAVDVTAYLWTDYKKESPCVVLFNDSTLIEDPDIERFLPGVWKVNMYVVLKAEKLDGDLATAQLDNLIITTLGIVGELDDVQVGSIGTVENEKNTYACVVSFSKTFKLRKEDI